jgi:hypothetical protein
MRRILVFECGYTQGLTRGGFGGWVIFKGFVQGCTVAFYIRISTSFLKEYNIACWNNNEGVLFPDFGLRRHPSGLKAMEKGCWKVR